MWCVSIDASEDDEEDEGDSESEENEPNVTLQQIQAKLEDEKQMIMQNTGILAEVNYNSIFLPLSNYSIHGCSV